MDPTSKIFQIAVSPTSNVESRAVIPGTVETTSTTTRQSAKKTISCILARNLDSGMITPGDFSGMKQCPSSESRRLDSRSST